MSKVPAVGSRVTLTTTRGYGGGNQPLEEAAIAGTVRAVHARPWGTDAEVALDAPALVGNPEWGPVDWVSVSLCSLVGE